MAPRLLPPVLRCTILSAALGLGACRLGIENPNAPDINKVLDTEIETLLRAEYLRFHFGLYGTVATVWPMTAVQSFENFSQLGNNCMGQRLGIPRPANANHIGNQCGAEQVQVWNIENEVMRFTSRIISKLADTLSVPKFSLGSPAQDARARAVAEFERGLALGYLALIYDSVAVVSQDTGPEEAGVFVGYQEAMDSSLVGLQRAIEAATANVSGPNGFPLPPGWIPGPTAMSSAEFVKLVRSYRARFRANVARNPAEREAVNWDLVIADTQNGITTDHFNTTAVVSGPFNRWVAQWHAYGSWHQMTPFILGMGDGADGAYAAWIALPLEQRGAGTSFFMVSPDLRLPQGESRSAQQSDFAITSCTAARTICKRYFLNRLGQNDITAGPTWGQSNYDFVRFNSWRISGDAGTGQSGNLPFFTRAELDLLEAEGEIRRGNYAVAAGLINTTRVARGGLPEITIFDGTSPMPGGAACVPKVPSNAGSVGGGTVACGNMMEAMKWEKRLETLQTHFAAWFLDSRGWGDLPEGTGVHWAVPWQELQARGRTGNQIYSIGGLGTGYPGSAAKGTYGW